MDHRGQQGKLEESPKPEETVWLYIKHYRQGPIYIFPELKLRGPIPNFHIYVSMSDLYIPTIGPPILLQQNWRTDQRNI